MMKSSEERFGRGEEEKERGLHCWERLSDIEGEKHSR